MGLLFKKHKTRFRYALKPVFAMLVSRHKEMEIKEWGIFKDKTYQSILANPTEYLGTDLPEKELMINIVDEIFLEFDKDLKLKISGGNKTN